MAFWILKTEPSEYSFARLRTDRRTRWEGITNAAALKHLRAMHVGDDVLIYHTGDERALVGRARVVKAAYADPAEDDPRLVVVDVAAGDPLPAPIPLATLKADPLFHDSPLVKQGRLSVVPLTAEQWARLAGR
jgi:predicted RNA-binding protein with PUA-like domain